MVSYDKVGTWSCGKLWIRRNADENEVIFELKIWNIPKNAEVA